MAAYAYIAKDAAGNELSGVYTGIDSERTLRAELVKLGYVLVRAQREGGVGRFSRRVLSSATKHLHLRADLLPMESWPVFLRS